MLLERFSYACICWLLLFRRAFAEVGWLPVDRRSCRAGKRYPVLNVIRIAIGIGYEEKIVLFVIYATARDIFYIKADGNYSLLYSIHGEETIFERLGEIEERLDKHYFIRAGRSLIINISFIYKVHRKNRLCILKSFENIEHRIEVSEEGMRLIYHYLDENIGE